MSSDGARASKHRNDDSLTAIQHCIASCEQCHEMCLRTAMTHCLELGGRHTEPTHFRLMLNCAELCQTTANFMIADSPLHTLLCSACAEVCDACAKSCDGMDGMSDCATACTRCAENCRALLN